MPPTVRELGTTTWPEISGRPAVVVPVGSLEQHGPHLPLDTDTVIAEAVARGLAETMPGSLLAPAIAFGSSGEHQSFPGTSSMGGEALRLVVVELVRSMTTWSGDVILVNGHGGNVESLAAAVKQLRDEGHPVTWVPCRTEEVDLHAGLTETSLMLHLRPESVRLQLAEPGNTQPLSALMPALRSGGVAAVSDNGVLGDPTGATAEQGRQVLSAMVEAAVHDL